MERGGWRRLETRGEERGVEKREGRVERGREGRSGEKKRGEGGEGIVERRREERR